MLGLVDGLVASLPQITTAAVDMITALVQGLVAALPAIAQAATQILLALIDGLIAALPLLVEGSVANCPCAGKWDRTGVAAVIAENR